MHLVKYTVKYIYCISSHEKRAQRIIPLTQSSVSSSFTEWIISLTQLVCGNIPSGTIRSQYCKWTDHLTNTVLWQQFVVTCWKKSTEGQEKMDEKLLIAEVINPMLQSKTDMCVEISVRTGVWHHCGDAGRVEWRETSAWTYTQLHSCALFYVFDYILRQCSTQEWKNKL